MADRPKKALVLADHDPEPTWRWIADIHAGLPPVDWTIAPGWARRLPGPNGGRLAGAEQAPVLAARIGATARAFATEHCSESATLQCFGRHMIDLMCKRQ